MTVRELTHEQLTELKTNHLISVFTSAGDCPSWYDLATAGEIYTDDEMYDLYECFNFVNDDFGCTAGM